MTALSVLSSIFLKLRMRCNFIVSAVWYFDWSYTCRPHLNEIVWLNCDLITIQTAILEIWSLTTVLLAAKRQHFIKIEPILIKPEFKYLFYICYTTFWSNKHEKKERKNKTHKIHSTRLGCRQEFTAIWLHNILFLSLLWICKYITKYVLAALVGCFWSPPSHPLQTG